MLAGEEEDVALFLAAADTTINIFYFHFLLFHIGCHALVGDCGADLEDCSFFQQKGFRKYPWMIQSEPRSK